MTTELVTVPNVHLASVGTWLCSTGVWECTPDQLAAIVEAQADPGTSTPIIKLGHLETRSGIAEPALGRIINLRLSSDGMDLYGDIAGVPKWLADIMGSAYPRRSVEVTRNYVGATGHKHEAILTAVALLGVDVPAIESLEDVAALYAGDLVAATADSERGDTIVMLGKVKPMPKTGPLAKLRAIMASKRQARIAASVNMSDVYAEFYEALPEGSWAWVREVWSDFIIVDNDNGDLYRIPWAEVDGDVQFGDAERVAVQYVPAQDDESDDASNTDKVAMLARFSPTPTVAASATETNPDEGINEMQLSAEALAALGLDETADEAAVNAAIAAKLGDPTPTEPAPTPPPSDPAPGDPDPSPTVVVPDGFKLVSEQDADVLVSAARELRDSRKASLLDGAIAAGKFMPSSREHFAKLYDADPDGTRTIIDNLQPGMIPVTASSGHAHVPDSNAADDAVWRSFAAASGMPAFIEGEVQS